MKKLIVDLDDTICYTEKSDYKNAAPNTSFINKLKEYKDSGFEITIHTSRNVRTFSGNVGKINVHTLPIILDWLKEHDVPFDEVVVGKPWCGFEGFYIDDKSIRPSEFLKYSYSEIQQLLEKEKQ
ncbi:hypothetical protein [Cytophaga aurantiaca]|uniref:hypothetical protein n=1 Tax=Cytophaga aurantiaca TaxID=29530 RepID=UPI00037F782F|nr:hypothetical protein [Cytophaga aurantiaca]